MVGRRIKKQRTTVATVNRILCIEGEGERDGVSRSNGRRGSSGS